MIIFLLIIVITNATESINKQEYRNTEILHTQIQSKQYKRMFNLHKVQLKGEIEEAKETTTVEKSPIVTTEELTTSITENGKEQKSNEAINNKEDKGEGNVKEKTNEGVSQPKSGGD
ncbi:hypothetical protein CL6EHI_063240 [Entamoeba histolytica]|uniref:Uncharacterized protein n=2 Tax=Entamoeba histolytica TaxID=5759 RepID=C4MBR4_ENTH1|nr:hypothetical protein EHI_063240 [Entamoeba histolytica HM-1:IMSS]EAL45578.1 hypothetical protein EHI_063240 [Entamoeba histolytica HM-1:IMSS]GAT99574.1 hypothetical protein CL6EHI_063240 [Entamoeba histolytica]|eukprot:XP_650964.1 hypothetical protein EHI_063240 [Entamoeba histolytica HM-1:IMSS]